MVKCSVYIVCPSVLSCSNPKLHQTLEVKKIFKQENIMLQLTFNPGFTLTGFRTTRPCSVFPSFTLNKTWLYLNFQDDNFMVMIGGEYMSPDRLLLHKIRKNDQKNLFSIAKWGCDGFVVCLGIIKLSGQQ